MKTVSFVNTNTIEPYVAPIAFDYLSAPLKNAGFNLELLDLCFKKNIEKAIIAHTSKIQPDYWAVTIRNTDDVYFSSRDNFLIGIKNIIVTLRENINIPVIIGGSGFSVMPDVLLDYMEADFGIINEGELSFPKLLCYLEENKNLSEVEGLVYRVNNKVHINNYNTRSSKYCFSYKRDIVDNTKYFKLGANIGIETKRGCNRHCIYCVDPIIKGKNIRFKKINHLIKEIKYLLSIGVNVFHINDSEFNLSISHSTRFCQEIINNNLQDKIKWYTYLIPKPFPERLAVIMKKSGCAGINFGVDSADSKMLKKMGRDFNFNDIKNAIHMAKKNNLEHAIELLVGGPGETNSTIINSINSIKSLDPQCVMVNVGLRIFPGTELESIVQKEGFDKNNLNLHGSIENNKNLLEPIFYLSHHLGENPLSVIDEIIGNDPRFLGYGKNFKEMNYNGNELLTKAISEGKRGAYWSIIYHEKNK